MYKLDIMLCYFLFCKLFFYFVLKPETICMKKRFVFKLSLL